MALRRVLNDRRGVTLLELLIASVLLSLVIAAAGAIYINGVRFLGAMRQSTANFQVPSLRPLIARIDMGNLAVVDNPGPATGKQLHVRCDCDPATLTPQNDGPGVNDWWFHFRIIQGGGNTAVRMVVDQNPNTNVNAGDTMILDNVDRPNSDFTLVNASGLGVPTVVEMVIAFTNPNVTIKTRAAVTGGAKQ